MGDYYQTIADIDADAQSAGDLAKRLCEWLVSRQIIVPQESDCVYGKPLGHAPGDNCDFAADGAKAWLPQIQPNGVQFIVGRTVFYSMGSEITAVCKACGGRFRANDAWSAALGDWYEGKGPGLLACEHCRAEAPITEWQHDPPWALGYLGVKFWNWPTLLPEFIDEVSKFLGHRVHLVWGKV